MEDLTDIVEIPESLKTKEPNSLRFLLCNIRGFYSKKLTLEKIVNDLDSDVILITETHCANANLPVLPNFRSFVRNRETRAKGGIAILVRESRARDCLQMWSGQGEQETLAVMFPTIEPKLVVMTNYGAQMNSFGSSVPEANLLEIHGMIAGWLERLQGCLIPHLVTIFMN